jgi:hypothetical protein
MVEFVHCPFVLMFVCAKLPPGGITTTLYIIRFGNTAFRVNDAHVNFQERKLEYRGGGILARGQAAGIAAGSGCNF